MNIKELTEDIGRYERYLLGLQMNVKKVPPAEDGKVLLPTRNFIQHLRLANRKVLLIAEQAKAAKAVKTRGHLRVVGDIDKLVTRASTMLQGYQDLLKSVEDTMKQQRQRATG